MDKATDTQLIERARKKYNHGNETSDALKRYHERIRQIIDTGPENSRQREMLSHYVMTSRRELKNTLYWEDEIISPAVWEKQNIKIKP